MNDWLKTATATFAGGAVAIALVAIPTFVWLPREFDEIKVEAVAARNEANLARIASQDAKATSSLTLERIDKLVVSIARMDAKAILGQTNIVGGVEYLLNSNGEANEVLSVLFPPDVAEIIVKSGTLSNFKHSKFEGVDWIFVDKDVFNEFTLSDQKLIEDSLERINARFFKE